MTPEPVTQVDHYWPGKTISFPFHEAWNTNDWTLPVIDLGTDPDDPEENYTHAGTEGWDFNIPERGGSGSDQHARIQINGGSCAIFQVLGEGREVTFWAAADYYGIEMQLLQPGFAGPIVSGWVAIAEQARYPGPESVAITYLLEEGQTYWLAVGSASFIEIRTAPLGASYLHYGDAFVMSADYTSLPTNNERLSASDVIIAADGGTYTSEPTLNHAFDTSVTADDDPSTTSFYYTGWWLYEPEHATDFTVQVPTDPEGGPTASFAWFSSTATSHDVGPVVATSTDGTPISGHLDANERAWIQVGSPTTYLNALIYTVIVSGAKSVVQAPPSGGEDAVDPTTKPPRPSRTFDPGATTPAVPAPQTCTSMLDLVREFSASVKRSVRIVGANTIEMVNPDEALPSAFVTDQDASYYTSTTMTLAANSKVLSLEKGNMDLEVEAILVANDVGLITSSFRVPGRLPFPDLDPAPVSRVSYTFTPTKFEASVSLAYLDVPLVVRER